MVTLYLGGLMEITRTPTGRTETRRIYAVDETPIAVRSTRTTSPLDTETAYLTTDRNGSLRAALVNDATGSVAILAYTPYGIPRTGTALGNRGYLDAPHDPMTGLIYLNNRYMDPAIGVFLSVDPLVSKTGDPYLYAAGNPTTLSDPSGLDPGWAHDTDPCNDAGYYTCATAKGGPSRGKQVLNSYGRRALDEIDRGIGVDASRWCHLNGSSLVNGCGAPPETGEYERPGQVYPVLEYLSQFGGYAADGAAGGAEGATVSVAGYTTARGTTVLSYTRYRAGLADFGNGIAPAGKLTVGTRWVGRAFVAPQAGVTAFDSWRATEGHTTAYRLSYTAVKTVVTTGGALAGASGGASGGAAIGCWGGPWGCAIGGFVGGVGGGIVGYIVADEVTDWIWNYTYEQVTG